MGYAFAKDGTESRALQVYKYLPSGRGDMKDKEGRRRRNNIRNRNRQFA